MQSSTNPFSFELLSEATTLTILLTVFCGVGFGLSATFFCIGIINPILAVQILENLLGPETTNPHYSYTLNFLQAHYKNHGELVKTHTDIMKKDIRIPKHIEPKLSLINRDINHLPSTIKLNSDLISKVVSAINSKIDIINITEETDHFKISLSIKKTNMPLLFPARLNRLIDLAVNLLVKIYCQTREYTDRVKSAKEEKIAKERRIKRQLERNDERLIQKMSETISKEIESLLTKLDEKYKNAKSSCKAQYQFAESIYKKTNSDKLKKFSQRVVSAYQQLEKKEIELDSLTTELINCTNINAVKSKIHHESLSISSLANAVKQHYKEFEIAYIKEPQPQSASTTKAILSKMNNDAPQTATNSSQKPPAGSLTPVSNDNSINADVAIPEELQTIGLSSHQLAAFVREPFSIRNSI